MIATLAGALGPAGLAWAQTSMLVCTTAGEPPTTEVAKFREAGERSFLFRTVQRRLGAPLSCRIDHALPTLISIVWAFPQEAAFTLYASPGIEMVNHAIVMPGLTEGEALALLKEGEKSFSTPPCGIDWSKPVREKGGSLNIGGTNNVSYWGSACNCHGRIGYAGQKVVALGMAC